MNPRFYRLEGKVPVLCSVMEWAESFERLETRRVKLTKFPQSDIYVSTVFLGLDHGFSNSGPPVLFVTMVFGLDPNDEYQDRCSTWHEAIAMHARGISHAIAIIIAAPVKQIE